MDNIIKKPKRSANKSLRAVQMRINQEILKGVIVFMEMEQRTSFSNACEILVQKGLESVGISNVATV